jgi:alkanesulfonate monooxygenase SsuD/methylene tetrahydromethanopterin reductase-like flavin-dependent oxidoreductase (luciferase family)
MTLSLGIDTFGDVALDADGLPKPQDQVLRDVVEQGVLDQVGIDFIGEHHRPDFAISAPEIVLAALAGRTDRIKLGTAVTVLSTDDPVRVFQRFSTLNALSGGRAEPILGRGSFTESYPLFGFDTADYDQLFEERLDLFAKLLSRKTASPGRARPAAGCRTRSVYPAAGPQPMTVWVGVGGSPESVVRVVRQDLQLMLAIIGGDARRFAPYVDLYQRACDQLGRPCARSACIRRALLPKPTKSRSRAALAALCRNVRPSSAASAAGRRSTKDRFLNEVRHGALYVGSPETVARKIAKTVGTLGLPALRPEIRHRPVPHGQLMDCIRLYGEKVIPMVHGDMTPGRSIGLSPGGRQQRAF